MAQTRTMTTAPVLETTPTRRAPRVAVQGATKIGSARNTPVNPGRVLNVSMGGALVLSPARVEQGSTIQLELGAPIFPIARLVSARVMHVEHAPAHLMTELAQKGKELNKKAEAYLLGCEFNILDEEMRKTLAKFVRDHAEEEHKRRAGTQQGDARIHTARDRTIAIQRPAAPPWAYALGLATGAYVVATGIWQDEDDLTIALHGAAALAIFWIAGRVASRIWLQLEAWRMPEATIIAATDGMATDIDEVLADADSALDAPTDDRGENASADSETPPESIAGTDVPAEIAA